MKPSRFTEEQIIGILREQEAGAKNASTASAARRSTNGKRSTAVWKCRDAKRLKALEDENAKLACSALGADCTSVRYRSSRPNDALVRARLRELAAIRRRFGYRRLHILLRREGIAMNHKKLRRLYREERLQGAS